MTEPHCTRTSCPGCWRPVYAIGYAIDVDHDCPAAGRPVALEPCDCADGWRGDYLCDRCEGGCYTAELVEGPALPFDLDHPLNLPPGYGEGEGEEMAA